MRPAVVFFLMISSCLLTLTATFFSITSVLKPDYLKLNVSVSSCVLGWMSLVALGVFTEHSLTCSCNHEAVYHRTWTNIGGDNDTPQKDETTMEEDNSRLFCMIHGC